MNRFFRTAYSTTLVYLCLTFSGVLITGISMPFPSFSCLYFGLLIFLLPGMSKKLNGKERMLYVVGSMTAVLGFLPVALWHCPMIHWIIHLSGIIAAAGSLVILRHRTTHGFFLEKFKFTMVALCIMIGLICLVMRTDIFQGGQSPERYKVVSLAVNSIIPCAIILLASGVLLLRGLRAQPGKAVDEQAFNRRQLRDTLIFAILVTLVFSADPFSYLGRAISFLLNEVLRPSFRFIAQLIASLMRCMSFWRRMTENAQPTEEPAELRPVPDAEPSEIKTEDYYTEGNDSTLVIEYIYMAAAALIFLYIIVLQIRKLTGNLRQRSKDRGSGYPNETWELLPVNEGTCRDKKPKRRKSNPRERIRYLYSEFLRYLHKSRVNFARTNTCGEIQHEAEKLSVADQTTLSDITERYEEARYHMQEMPSETDARVMKDLLEKIKKGP